MGAQRRKKILIVDDDPAIRAVLGLALGEAGYAVSEVPGGEEALASLKRRSFDLVILDINMPDVDGYEVLRRMREMPSRRSTPVFVVSANGHEPSGVIREVAGGAVGRLRKPFNLSELEHAVSAALAESAAERATRHEVQTRAADVYRSLIALRAAGGEDDDEPARRGRLALRSR